MISSRANILDKLNSKRKTVTVKMAIYNSDFSGDSVVMAIAGDLHEIIAQAIMVCYREMARAWNTCSAFDIDFREGQYHSAQTDTRVARNASEEFCNQLKRAVPYYYKGVSKIELSIAGAFYFEVELYLPKFKIGNKVRFGEWTGNVIGTSGDGVYHLDTLRGGREEVSPYVPEKELTLIQ